MQLENVGLSVNRRRALTGFAFACVCIVINIPLLTSYLAISSPDVGDLRFHLTRIFGLAQGLCDGQFPVRIQSVQLNGYGYPVSIMYGDAFLYPSALLVVLGLSVTAAYKVFLVCVNVFTAAMAYCVARNVSGSRLIGMAICCLWTFAPYRYSDIYPRAAVGEFLALAFLPVLCYGLYLLFWQKSVDGKVLKNHSWLWLAAGASGIILSHAISVIMTGLVFTPLLVLGLIFHHDKKVWINLGKALGATACLCAWFLVPFLQYYSSGTMNLTTYAPEWKMGYTATAPTELGQLGLVFWPMTNPITGLDYGISGDSPQQVGWAILMGLLIFIAALIAKWPISEKTMRNIGLAASAVGILCLWFITPAFPWKIDNAFAVWLSSIQFPSRFVGLLSIVLIIVGFCGLLILRGGILLKRYLAPALGVLVAISILEVGVANTTFFEHSARFPEFSIAESGHTLGAANGEYIPTGTDSNHYLDAIKQSSLTPSSSKGVEIDNYSKNGTSVSFDVIKSGGVQLACQCSTMRATR